LPLAVALGLGCALCWGIGDFVGGTQSRRIPALAVVFWSHVASGLVMFGIVLSLEQTVPVPTIAWGALAGGVGGLALMAFYRGLAVGVMSIVAPIAASGAVVPVVWGVVAGETPGALEWAGIVAAVAGVVIVSRPAADEAIPGSRRLSLLLAGAAGLGFGTFFVIVDHAADLVEMGPVWVMAGVRLGSLLTLGSIGLMRPREARWPGRRMPVIAALGLVDITATTLFAFASVEGNIAVVAVVSSQYPVVTIALARAFLGERLSAAQAAGAVLALAGVGLLSAG
jgi:drug/metabolite transporter (DMT)-like permease